MSKLKFIYVIGVSLALGATPVLAQDGAPVKKTEVVQNADGSYTVIEYPVGREVIVNLSPTGVVTNGKGQVRVMRADTGTRVWVDVGGMPADAKSVYAYTVDPMGKVQLLGPVAVNGGIGKGEFSTSLNQFMVVLSPTSDVTGFESETPVYFRSSVPEGFSVIPTQRTAIDNVRAGTGPISSAYEVPMLGVPSFGDRTTEMNIDFSGELEGLKAKAYIDTRANGTTQIKMRFDDMKMAPKNKRFILWAAAPAGEYTKLGQVVNTGQRQEAEIRSETALPDFGLFVTIEEEDVTVPTSRNFSVFRKL